ncbi:MAG: DUF542 domain-containing protein [Planctomycetaceae bacterium]|nr:DUF542 domain-containing protein [Planctomycetaceae bacterium]
MSDCTSDTAVADWVIEHPEALAVFERFGIDYACGGRSLAYACTQQGVSLTDVLASLQLAITGRRSETDHHTR